MDFLTMPNTDKNLKTNMSGLYSRYIIFCWVAKDVWGLVVKRQIKDENIKKKIHLLTKTHFCTWRGIAGSIAGVVMNGCACVVRDEIMRGKRSWMVRTVKRGEGPDDKVQGHDIRCSGRGNPGRQRLQGQRWQAPGSSAGDKWLPPSKWPQRETRS